MKTILIPIDATAASENAVDFSLEWAKRYQYDHIILLNTSYESMFGHIAIGATFALASGEQLNQQQEEAAALLARLCGRIIDKAPGLQVSTETSKLPLLRCIISSLKSDPSIELVVLGSSHTPVANDSFVSANIISVSRASPVKTLVVPSGCGYKPVNTIVVPCDIGSIRTVERLDRIKARFEQENVRLMLLNVSTKETPVSDVEKEKWEQAISSYLKGMEYSIHFETDKDIINGILSFMASHEADLIAALPGEHSFLYYLANKSISEGLYKNMRHAVLILK